jgi:hypothetical protein
MILTLADLKQLCRQYDKEPEAHWQENEWEGFSFYTWVKNKYNPSKQTHQEYMKEKEEWEQSLENKSA